MQANNQQKKKKKKKKRHRWSSRIEAMVQSSKERGHGVKVPSSPSTMRKIKPRSPLVLAENVQDEDDEVPTLNLNATEKSSPTGYTRDSFARKPLIMTAGTLALYQMLLALHLGLSSPQKQKTRLINGKKGDLIFNYSKSNRSRRYGNSI